MNPDAIIAFTAAAAASALALLAVLRPPRNLARMMFFAGMLLLGGEACLVGAATVARDASWVLFSLNVRLGMLSLLPGLWLCFSLSYSRGNAREFLKRWRLPVILAFAVPIGLALWAQGRFIHLQPWPDSPEQFSLALNVAGRGLLLCSLIGAILVMSNLERTFRASVGTQRWRIKYVVIGLGLLFVVRFYTASQEFLLGPFDPLLQRINSAALLLACLLVAVSHRRTIRFEVDVYPSHAVLRGSLTLFLAGVYLLLVGVFARLAASWGGDTAFAVKAFVVLFALVLPCILLLSERARLRVRQAVSRHFHRPLHDYRQVWERFTERTAACVDQSELCRAVVRLVSEHFQALSVSIWLAAPERKQLVLGGSTSMPEALAEDLKPSAADAEEVMDGAGRLSAPVNLDSSTEPWAAALRRCAPREFRTGGQRVCVPLSAGGQLLGVMIVGDRVGGTGFTTQDMDLLKNLGGQAAACLLNIQLTGRLMQTREMEAFQAMSAFFVHDLKNTASALSLMLRNLPIHFDDPAFREDTLRGVSSTVDHINSLIQRLSSMRRHLETRPVPSDLNAVVAASLERFQVPAGVRVRTSFAPLPQLPLDADQFQEVLTNLLINAREAMEGGGEIRVVTRRDHSWAVVSVCDDGPGMTGDFMEHSLFRPFKSTKRNGLGIGMFQCKTIVEAHRGRIDVESEPGKGAAFHVRLPLSPEHHETQTAHR